MSELKENTNELEKVRAQLRKQNSLPQNFLRGLVAALGATVGLSIFLGLIALLLNFLATALGLQSFFEPIMQSLSR